MNKLTQDDCKLLTEFLGEKRHVVTVTNGIRECSCGVSGNLETIFNHAVNRTFTTTYDQHAVFVKLVELRKWDEFKLFVREIRLLRHIDQSMDWSAWLWLSPERFCKLCAVFLKEGV
jgi:hypothetical protein